MLWTSCKYYMSDSRDHLPSSQRVSNPLRCWTCTLNLLDRLNSNNDSSNSNMTNESRPSSAALCRGSAIWRHFEIIASFVRLSVSISLFWQRTVHPLRFQFTLPLWSNSLFSFYFFGKTSLLCIPTTIAFVSFFKQLNLCRMLFNTVIISSLAGDDDDGVGW